jgi:hypothetical protein
LPSRSLSNGLDKNRLFLHGISNESPLGLYRKCDVCRQSAHEIRNGLASGGAIGRMTVNGANFQAPEAGGPLVFDVGKGKVASAKERFRVKGVINADLFGQNRLPNLPCRRLKAAAGPCKILSNTVPRRPVRSR